MRRKEKTALILRIAERFGWKPGRIVKEILEWVEVLIVAGVLAILLMTFVVVRMTVPTGSMIPAIEPGDSFFVNILTYHFRRPQPGDIIVFWHPNDQLRGNRARFVKRLAAVGGQTVQIKEGALYVDGTRLSGDQFDRYYWMGDPRIRYGIHPTLVPEGKFFVLGDNSRDSLDSRFWGFIDQDNVIGVPLLRIWPLSRVGLIR
jgi:signal peptidase I